MAYIDKDKWGGPFDFYTAIKAYAEEDKDILGIDDDTMTSFPIMGDTPSIGNCTKRLINHGKWYIEKG